MNICSKFDTKNPAQILSGLNLLTDPGQTYEISILKHDGYMVTARFTDTAKMAKFVEGWNGRAKGLYFTLNPIKPECIPAKGKRTDADAILRRRLLLIDSDPQNKLGADKEGNPDGSHKAGISSTDEEHTHALNRARDVRSYLSSISWPDPVFADSGNGGHLDYRIDLPNDPASTELIRRVLQALADKFSDDKVDIDTRLYDAPRICKVYGTKTMKGETTAERPHRVACILEAPDTLDTVGRDLLEQVAGSVYPKSDKGETTATTAPKKAPSGQVAKSIAKMERIISEAGLEVVKEKPENGSYAGRWILAECPFCGKDSAVLTVSPDGKLGFGCHHNSCNGKDGPKKIWVDFSKKFVTKGKGEKGDMYGDMACDFVTHYTDKGETPLYIGGRTYFYAKCRYAECDELPMRVRAFFHLQGWSQSNNVVGNVVPIIQSHAWKDAGHTGAMPFWMGEGQSPFSNVRNVIAYANGLLDTAKADVGLLPHSSSWVSTVCLPFAYDPAAACPTWRKFLGEVFEGDPDRENLLQEFFGYCLTQDTSLQKALVLVGKPRSGKGTVQRVLSSLVGTHNATGFSLDKLVTEFGLSGLVNKSVATVGEVELNSNPHKSKIVELLKSIIGEDEVMVNTKHDPNMKSAKLPTRFVIASNTVPRLMDASGALLHRLIFLPFEMSFAGREDTELAEKLTDELPGIANWALVGLKRLRLQGGRFSLGSAHKAIAGQFSADTTPVRAWVAACLLVSKWADPGDLPSDAITSNRDMMITKKAAYSHYREWCEEQDIDPAIPVWFHRDLRTLIPKLKEERTRANGWRERCYSGVGLKPVVMGDGPGGPGGPGKFLCNGNFQKNGEREKEEGETQKRESCSYSEKYLDHPDHPPVSQVIWDKTDTTATPPPAKWSAKWKAEYDKAQEERRRIELERCRPNEEGEDEETFRRRLMGV